MNRYRGSPASGLLHPVKRRDESPAGGRQRPAPTLVVFCRRPAPGAGKQRLAARLGQAVAYAAARHFLDCALEDARAWPGAVILAPASTVDRAWAATLLPGKAMVLAQPEGNLGERLMAVDRLARAAGHRQLCYIGSDAPALTPAFYREVLDRLGASDVLLARAADGGVTLMAATRPWPELADLPWSTARLGGSLAARCLASGLSVQQLDGRYDVDREQDLVHLARDLAGDPRPARARLRRWLRCIGC